MSDFVKPINLSKNQRWFLTSIILTTLLGLFLWIYICGLSFLVEDAVHHPLSPKENYWSNKFKSNATKRPIDELRLMVRHSQYLDSKNLTDNFLTDFLESREDDPLKTYGLSKRDDPSK